MSYQVGSACYSTKQEAGVAACVAYVPVSELISDGSALRTVSCVSSDPTTGALRLRVTTTPTDGSSSYSSMILLSQFFPDCREADYVAAGEVVFGALLAAWASAYALNYVRRFLDWSRGDS